MEFFISSEARNSCRPLNSLVPQELELIYKMAEDQLDQGREYYDFRYLSCFKNWLTEDETVLIDKYFETVSRDRLSPVIIEDYEPPFIEFFKKKYLDGDICVIFSQGEENLIFKPENERELLTYLVMGLREVQLYSFFDLKSKTYFIPLRDLTLLVATPKGEPVDFENITLNILD